MNVRVTPGDIDIHAVMSRHGVHNSCKLAFAISISSDRYTYCVNSKIFHTEGSFKQSYTENSVDVSCYEVKDWHGRQQNVFRRLVP